MRPSVLVTRATFPDIANRLREHFDVTDNPSDTILSPSELIARLQGKQGVMSTGSERIDAALLDACPNSRPCAMWAWATTTSTWPPARPAAWS